MERKKVLILVEGAMMVALAFALSFITQFIPFLNLPWGGSITLLSMLPIVVYSIRNGVKYGVMCSFVYSLTQLAQGIVGGLFGWGLTPIMLVGCIFLDYIGAFTVIGFAGLFRDKGMKGWIGGTVMVIAVRYLFHITSGAIIFKSAGIIWTALGEINNPWLYSTIYNGCYMLPEMIFTTIGAAVLFKTGAIKMILKKQTSTT